MITLKQSGSFSKTDAFLKRLSSGRYLSNLDKYAKEGLDALIAATPVDSGLTADSWYYQITESKDSIRIEYCNSNIQDGVPIAVILQYGHGTRNGGWVEGQDYINPAIKPVFEKIADKIWKEATK